jgi:hypothetical protein
MFSPPAADPCGSSRRTTTTIIIALLPSRNKACHDLFSLISVLLLCFQVEVLPVTKYHQTQ